MSTIVNERPVPLLRRPNKVLTFSFPELKPSSFDRSRHGEDDGDNERSPALPNDRFSKPTFKQVNTFF